MVRFSCFSLHARDHSSKKAVQQHPTQIFPNKMHKEVPGQLQDTGSKESRSSACSNLNADAIPSPSTPEQMETPSFECGQPEEVIAVSCVQDDLEIQQSCIKKSQSLGSGLDRGGFSCSTDIEGELEGRFLFGDSSEKGLPRGLDPFNKSESADSFNRHDSEMYYDRDLLVHSSNQNQDYVHHEFLFSIEDQRLVDRGLHGDSHELYHVGHAVPGNFAHVKPHISKSRSLPSLCGANNLSYLSPCKLPQRSRSFEGLCTIGMKDQFCPGPGGLRNGIFNPCGDLSGCNMELLSNLVGTKSPCRAGAEEYTSFNMHCCSTEMLDQERDAVNRPVHFSDEYESHNLNDMVDDFKEPEMHDIQIKDGNREKYFHRQWDNLTGEELNLRRVQDWLSQIDIHEKFPTEIIEDQSSGSVAKMKDAVHSTTASKPDTRGNPGMEAAYKYISSLTAVSSSVQMAGLGLVVIPFLGAFTSLRLLNLSGNSIVRINAGALPRGLHVLNLSKNNISTVEGLRELTRLRVLDLSYNRILRIGHGLSACSSLKELYLAGNKISEVEGLHRLLKLSILDLHYNKISTTKCLGQLTANYGSLQAMNLDGNPAQRNVGDEQLKKYVLSLLPHLVYFNNNVIKASSSKEVSDRSTRSSTSYQFDRLRSEQKRLRRGHHGSSHRKPTLINHGKSVHATSSLLKQPRTAHAPLPPPGSKPGHLPIDPKLLSLQLSNSIRRSQSTGNLG